ncbi:MAG: hypothetical protein M3446_06320 [Actinomycetota bacterium]|nr:hypothetical protein [Actinomycetota bacterium]
MAGGLVLTPLALLGVNQATSTTVNAEPAEFVFVCKFVTTPGDGEVLQTGQNPIRVSANSTQGAVVGAFFNDAQGRSFVLAIDNGRPGPKDDPGVAECEAVINPPPTTTTVPATTTTVPGETGTTVPATTTTVPGETGTTVPSTTPTVPNSGTPTDVPGNQPVFELPETK